MKTVKTHRYAGPKGITLFDAVNGAELLRLDGGSWLGVTEDSNEWLHVITAQHDGWVRKAETVDAKPFTLKAKFSDKVKGLIHNYVL
jgi:hypothetical protein